MLRATTKKRAHVESTTQIARKKTRTAPNKKTALTQPEGEGTLEPIRSDEITLRNQQQSPLLRLPAELRDEIWAYVFERRTAHVESTRYYGVRGVGHITYRECRQCLSDQAVYELSLQGAADKDRYEWKAEELFQPRTRGYACVHHQCARNGPDTAFSFSVPLVCKQMYRETTPIMWKATTFCFRQSAAFEDFVRRPASRKHLHLIEEISILLAEWDGDRGWKSAITPARVASFPALRSLHLVIRTERWYDSVSGRGPPKFSDLMKDPPSHFNYLPNLIRQFRQLPLKERETTVFVARLWDEGSTYYAPGRFHMTPALRDPVNERREIAEVIRGFLLDYRPRRLSVRRRG